MDCGKIINYYDEGIGSGSAGIRCKECNPKYIDTANIEYCNRCGKKIIVNSPEDYGIENGKIICPGCLYRGMTE